MKIKIKMSVVFNDITTEHLEFNTLNESEINQSIIESIDNFIKINNLDANYQSLSESEKRDYFDYRRHTFLNVIKFNNSNEISIKLHDYSYSTRIVNLTIFSDEFCAKYYSDIEKLEQQLFYIYDLGGLYRNESYYLTKENKFLNDYAEKLLFKTYDQALGYLNSNKETINIAGWEGKIDSQNIYLDDDVFKFSNKYLSE